jgi:hypothetical protein
MDMKLAKLIDFAEQYEVDKDAVSDKRKKTAWLAAIVLKSLGLIDLRKMAKELYVAEPDGDDDDEVKDLLASALLEEMGVVPIDRPFARRKKARRGAGASRLRSHKKRV